MKPFKKMALTSYAQFFPLFALAWIGLPLLGVVPFWVGLFFCGLVFLAFLRQVRAYRLNPGRLFIWGLLPAGAGILFQYRTLLQYEPLMALALLTAAFKLCIRKDLRDLRLATMLMIFLVAGVSLSSQTNMIIVHIVISFLWIGMIFLETSKGSSNFSGIFTSAMQVLNYFFMALPVIIFIYIFFPRYEEALFSIYRFKGQGRTGISGEVYPGSIGNIVEDETPAFRAFLDSPVNMKDLYWRVLTLSYTDGDKWRESIIDRRPYGAVAPVMPEGRAVRQEILLDPLLENYLVALDLPHRIESLSEKKIKAVAAGARTFRLTLEPRFRLRYRAVSSIHHDFTSDDRKEKIYCWVPMELSDAVQDLTGKWRKASRSDAEYLNHVLQYFGNHLLYSLEPGAYNDRQNFLDQLLFTVRRGFCEHFASAFALLARAQGIPSRLVAGYHGGTYNPHGRYWMVRQKNAHVWTEVFLKDKGWVRIDPTAFIKPERIESGNYDRDYGGWFRQMPFYSYLQNMTLRVDDLNTRWYQFQLALSLSLQNRISQNKISMMLKQYHLAAGAAIGALLCGGLLVFLHQFVTRVRNHNKLDVQLVNIYKNVLRRMERKQVFKAPQEGPLDFLKRLETTDQFGTAGMAPFLRAYLDLRYGPDPLTREKVRQLRYLAKRVGC